MEQENTTVSVNANEVVENTEKDTQEQNSNETKTFTQEQVEKMLKERVDRQKAAFDKKLSEEKAKAIDDYKASLEEDKRLNKLSETERLKEKLAKADEELQLLKAKQQRSDMLIASRNELSNLGLDVSEEVLDFVTTDNAESTQANIKALSDFVEQQRSVWEQERAKGRTPKNLTQADNKQSITQADFNKMSFAEKQELYNNNKELFSKLTGGN